MLHRVKEHGANSAIIEPASDNIAIRRACAPVGFQREHIIRRKGKRLNQPA